MTEKPIKETIDDYLNQLNSDPNAQRKRHLEYELDQLKKYQDRHPNVEGTPSPLELFCDENPEAFECKIFDL
jgi:hypothetical protein